MILYYENTDIEEDMDDDLNYKDDEYNYDPKIGEMFANDILSVLNDLIEKGNVLDEDFTSNGNMINHFKNHCIGKNRNKKSNRSKVFYDFVDNSQYSQYEKKVSHEINNTEYEIGSLYDYDLISKYIRKLFEGNVAIKFCNSCGLKSSGESISLSILSYSSDVTNNYMKSNTVDICVKNSAGRTITLYPVDVNYLQNKLNNIIKKYSEYTDVKELDFNND